MYRSDDLQELVEEREDDGEENSHEIETEGHDRERWIILVGDNSCNFWDRGVFFFFEGDGRALNVVLLVVGLLRGVLELLFGRHVGGEMQV